MGHARSSWIKGYLSVSCAQSPSFQLVQRTGFRESGADASDLRVVYRTSVLREPQAGRHVGLEPKTCIGLIAGDVFLVAWRPANDALASGLPDVGIDS